MTKTPLSKKSKTLKKPVVNAKSRKRVMACSMELPESKSPTPKVLPHSWKNPKYNVDMCERIQEWYKDGQSDAEIANQLDICKDTYYEWIKRYPEFAEAVKRGKTASESWWQILGKQLGNGSVKGSDKVWLIMMKNRFQFRDTIELEDCNHLGLNRTVKELQNLIALHKKHEADY